MRWGRHGIAAAITAAILGVTVAVLAAVRWLSGDLPISLHNYLAMAAAVIGLCIVTGGLMWLAFYSSRAGWDDIDREP